MTVLDHIRELLYTEDCVIIPDFGGFVANYRPAKIDFKTQEMHPPEKQIAFNEKLQNNDGLLINRITSAEGISYEQAEQKVRALVRKLRTSLKTGKEVKVREIGSFRMKKGTLHFEPENSINYLRNSYGMESFHFPMLQTPAKRVSKPEKRMEPVTKQRRRPSLVPLLIGLPIIGALIYAPFYFENQESRNVYGKAGMEISMDMTKRLISLNAADFDLERKQLSEAVEESTTEAPVKSEPKPEPATEPKQVTKQASGNFYVIGGSFASVENARDVVSKYGILGYDCEILPTDNGMNRVALKSFESWSTAHQSLPKMKSTTGKEDLWILQN
ncbi:MAG: HU family DNA-binding protein [Bacteroidota bacterium]